MSNLKLYKSYTGRPIQKETMSWPTNDEIFDKEQEYTGKTYQQAIQEKDTATPPHFWNDSSYETYKESRPQINYDLLIKNIWEDENDVKKGYDKKTDTWTPHNSPEGGDTTLGPGLKTLSPERRRKIAELKNKIPTDLLTTWLKEDIQIHEQALQKEFKDEWKDIPANIKMGLIDMRHNLGSLGSFQKLLQAVKDKDIKEIQKQSKTTYKSANGKIVFDERRWNRRIQKYFNKWKMGGSVNYTSQFTLGGTLKSMLGTNY